MSQHIFQSKYVSKLQFYYYYIIKTATLCHLKMYIESCKRFEDRSWWIEWKSTRICQKFTIASWGIRPKSTSTSTWQHDRYKQQLIDQQESLGNRLALFCTFLHLILKFLCILKHWHSEYNRKLVLRIILFI